MGRQAAVVQSAPEDPKYLFDPENYRENSYLSDKMAPLGLMIMGFTLPILHNYVNRRPVFSGIHVTITATLAGLAAGIWYQKYSERYWAERDAIFRHYISLHPEDFPAKERVLIGDMLKPWVPTR